MITIIKIACTVLALIVGYFTDNLFLVIGLIFGWFAFKHFIHRNFLWTIGLTVVVALAAYQALLGDGSVSQEIVGSLLAVAVIVGAFKLFFGRR